MPELLVPFDNSPSALRALDHAVAWARVRDGVSLHVLTVLDSVGPDTQELIDPVEIDRVLGAEAQQQQRAARERLDPTGVSCVYHAQAGTPARVIADYARDHSVSHIIMGTRGLGKIAGLLMGSVANKVLHDVDCPVTLVK
jgi:nucleotide-binding universal stress UspA family protein